MSDRFPNLKISISGIRGVVGEGLSPRSLSDILSAFALVFKAGKIIIGRDTRSSSEWISSLAKAILQAFGNQVVDVGIVTTPTMGIVVPALRAQAGVMVTASHNPPPWNGLKFFDHRGLFIDQTTLARIEKGVSNDQLDYARYDQLHPQVYYDRAIQDHIEAACALNFLHLEDVRKAAFRVGYDGNGGTGCVIFPALFERLGVECVPVGCEVLGQFAHPLEPIPENLQKVAEIFQKENLSVGFASDPDADRLVVFDEKGNILNEEFTLVLAALFALRHLRGPVVINQSTSALVEKIALGFGVECTRSKVGERNVVEKMLETGAVFGGEGNGGVILPDVHYGRDGIVAAILILTLMVSEKRPISEIIGELPKYYMLKDKIQDHPSFDINNPQIIQQFNPVSVDRSDGLRLTLKNGWVQIRRSNTEPVIRVIIEADSQQELNRLKGILKAWVTI
ncbi:phosphoglucosamine mutase [bacterium]|nr:phosphoglucosamine mutase [bacterium]